MTLRLLLQRTNELSVSHIGLIISTSCTTERIWTIFPTVTTLYMGGTKKSSLCCGQQVYLPQLWQYETVEWLNEIRQRYPQSLGSISMTWNPAKIRIGKNKDTDEKLRLANNYYIAFGRRPWINITSYPNFTSIPSDARQKLFRMGYTNLKIKGSNISKRQALYQDTFEALETVDIVPESYRCDFKDCEQKASV